MSRCLRDTVRRAAFVWAAGVLLAAQAWAVEPGASRGRAQSSTSFTAGSVVKDVRGALVWSMSIVCTTGPCTLVLYDSATANTSAAVIYEAKAATGEDTHVIFTTPLVTVNGLYAALQQGTGYGFVSYE